MYLDPGFGGMLLQAIVVIAAVGGAILFSIRKRITSLFSRNKTNTSPIEPDAITTYDEDDAVDMLDD